MSKSRFVRVDPNSIIQQFICLIHFRQSRLCDVVLVVEDLEIPAHKAVLAACSPYFYAMFTSDLTEAKADRIVLQEVAPRALSLLMEFVYTSEVQVTEENVQVWKTFNWCSSENVQFSS